MRDRTALSRSASCVLVPCADPATSVPVYASPGDVSVAPVRRRARVGQRAVSMGTAVQVRPGAAARTTAVRRGLDHAALATRVHYATLLLAYPLLLWLGRLTFFRHDEWRIVLGHTGAGSQPWDVFAPFDIHWSTAVVLVYRAVGAVVGSGSYLPYLGVALAVHVAAAHLLWRVLLRCGAERWVATLLVAAFLVLGAGWEALYWVLALTSTLPLALTLGAVLVCDRPGAPRRRDRAVVAALTVLAVMSGGPGVAMLVAPALVGLQRGGVRRAVGLVAPAAAVYALWLVLAGSAILGHPGAASNGVAGTVAGFVWDGLTASMATLLGPPALGAVALAALGAWMAVRARARALPAPVPACATAAVAVFALTALGRGNGGDATTSHYLYAGIALLLPGIALALTSLVRRLQLPRAVVLAGLGVVVAHSGAMLALDADALAFDDQQSRGWLLAAAKVSADGTALPDSVAEPILAWAVSTADVERLRADGVLVPPATLPAGVEAETRLRLHVAVSSTAVGGAAPTVLAIRGGTLAPAAGGCTLATPAGGDGFAVSVAYAAAGALRVEAATPTLLQVYLRGSLDAPADQAAKLLIPPGETRAVDATLPGTTLVIRVPTGSVRLCA
jgi:hypothetical protein